MPGTVYRAMSNCVCSGVETRLMTGPVSGYSVTASAAADTKGLALIL